MTNRIAMYCNDATPRERLESATIADWWFEFLFRRCGVFSVRMAEQQADAWEVIKTCGTKGAK